MRNTMLNNEQILERANQIAKFNNKTKATYFLFVDFTRPANQHRLFLVNMITQMVEYSGYTSHGSGSGDVTGRNLKFSNTPDSRMSSKGLFIAKEIYHSTKFKSKACRLDGLEKGINDNARKRAIVVHRSDYVDDDFIKDNGYPGRSWGCITVDPDYSDYVVEAISNGSLVYIHAG